MMMMTMTNSGNVKIGTLGGWMWSSRKVKVKKIRTKYRKFKCIQKKFRLTMLFIINGKFLYKILYKIIIENAYNILFLTINFGEFDALPRDDIYICTFLSISLWTKKFYLLNRRDIGRERESIESFSACHYLMKIKRPPVRPTLRAHHTEILFKYKCKYGLFAWSRE